MERNLKILGVIVVILSIALIFLGVRCFSFNTEVNNLKSQLLGLDNSTVLLEKEKSTLLDDVEKLKNDKEFLEKEFNKYQDLLVGKQGDIDSLYELLDSKEEDTKELSKNIEDLNKKIEDLNKEMSKKDENIKFLNEEINEMKKLLSEGSNILDDFYVKISLLAGDVDAYITKLKNEQPDNETGIKMLEDIRAKLKDIYY